ncbi:MAG: FtsX-like permease family protein [Roseivirga sp.]|nr:FtsX-like permease family protein [Roseivirga sp.]
MDPYLLIPRFYKALFRRLCRPDLYHELAGDLEEAFAENYEQHGLNSAKATYKKEVLKMLRPSVIRPFHFYRSNNTFDMFSNYLKLSIRNLWRDKEHSLVSIIGLAAGIIASVLIFQYTNFESSYDAMHDESDGRIYRMSRQTVSIETGEQISINATNFHGFHPTVADELPEVASSTQLFQANGVLTSDNTGHNVPDTYFSTGAFFDVFSFPLISGNNQDLDQPGTVFISESVSRRIFGNADPMGQLIHYNDNFSNVDVEVQVKGVFKDFPDNSHIKAEVLLSMADLNTFADNGWFGTMRLNEVTWRWVGYHTYIKAVRGADKKGLTRKLNTFINKYRAHYDEAQGRRPVIIPHELSELHFAKGVNAQLEPSNDEGTITMFKFIGVLIILIAWINFVNLATARAVKRAKEVGVRKALGAFKKQLIDQFLIETIFINTLALLLAIGIILIIIPAFHQFVDAPVFDYFTDFLPFWGIYLGVFVVGALISGFYPALVLTRFEPIKVLRGNFQNSNNSIWLRRVLMFLQFGLVLVMLSGILVIKSQIGFMMNQQMGMNINQTLVVNAPPTYIRDSTYTSKIETYRDAIEQFPSIRATSIAASVPGIRNTFGQTIYRTDRPSNESEFLYLNAIDPHFLSLFEIELIAGRQFDESLKGDGNVVLINEESVRALDFESPEDALGKRLVYPTGERRQIVGVVKDFNQMGMKFKVDPMAMNLDTARSSPFINIKISATNVSETVRQLERTYNEFFPSAPFDSFFLDQTFNQIYEEDRKFSAILEFFAVIAIFISCLGIFGLSSFLINQKVKEVSIRKVLGANLSQVIRVLTKEYVLLVTASTLISIPVAYLLTNNWLDTFLIRVNLNPIWFLAPIAGLVFILMTTVGRKTWKAVMVNPAKTLKDE